MTSQMAEPRLQTDRLPNLQMVFHFTPPDIMGSKEYVDWMSQFPADVKHVVINKDGQGNESTDLTTFVKKLNMMHPTVFPGLSDDMANKLASENKVSSMLPEGTTVLQAHLDQKIWMRPDLGNVEASTHTPNYESIEKEMAEIPEVTNMIAQIADEVKTEVKQVCQLNYFKLID